MSKENENEENENTEAEDAAAAEAELVDAVGSAIDEVTPDDVIEANKEAVEIDEGAEQTPEEIAAAAEAAEAAEAQAIIDAMTPEEKAAAEKEGEDDESDESDETGETEGEQTAEEKAAAEAEAAAAKADPINDPIPESTKAETATRIKALISIAKDKTVQADQGVEIIAQINDTGADPDQYANSLGFLRLYNSKDPAERKEALAVAEAVVRDLRVELGQGTVDLLENHDDLKAEVEADTLTEARAIEIATGREKTLLQTARTDADNVKTANAATTEALIAEGKTQLTTLETTLQASDEDYARLRPTFISLLKPALRKAHAADWGEVAQEIYVAVKKANPKPAAPVVPKNTPLRPKSSGGGSESKESGPDSALEAVNAALGAM